MPLIVLQPPSIKPENGTRPALRCYFSFTDIGDALIGAKVRLLVYDSDLYAATDLGISEGDDFAGFRADARPLTPAQRNPAYGPGAGVLLKADGEIAKTPGGSWILHGIDKNASTNPNASADRVQLVLEIRDKVEAAAGLIAYDVGDPSVAGVRELLVRLVLVESAAGMSAGTILLSNLNLNHTPTPGPVTLILDAREGRANAQVGGVRPPLDIHLTKPNPDSSRRFSPDLTGLYDSVPLADGENSALALQLNQAGRVLVGWFSPPPQHLQNVSRILGVVVPPGHHQVFLSFGALVVHLDERTPSGAFLMKWMTQAPNSAFNSLDPDDVVFPPNASRVKVGELRIVPTSNANAPPEVHIKFDPAAQAADRFTMTRASPRWSAGAIDFMPKQLVDVVMTEQVRPVPNSEWQHLRDLLSASRTPSLETLINAWDNAINDAERIAARDRISQQIDLREKPSMYRSAYASRLRAFLSSNFMQRTKENNDKFSFMEMLQKVIAEERNDLRDHGQTSSTIKEAFDSAGIGPEGDFLYTVEFEKQLGMSGTLIVKFGVWGFTASVSGFQLLDKDTSIPLEKRKKATLFDAEKDNVHFDGVFGETGIGIGISLAIGIPGLKQKGGGALIGSATFQSFAKLNPQDFALANFSVTAVKGPSASFGHAVSVGAGSSAYAELRLTNNVVLSTVVTKEGLKFTGPDVRPDDPRIDELKEFLKGFFDPQVEVSLASKAWGSGIFLLNRATDLIPKTITPPLLDPPLREEEVHVAHRETSSFFSVDSFVIDEHLAEENNRKGQSVRLTLEKFLAIDRAMLDSTESRVYAFGLASPEHNEVHNQILSENRADAVIQAVKDALGSALFKTTTIANGLGESLATSKDFEHGGGGLLDPPDDTAGRAQFLQRHPDQKPQWPSWRRVDLVVDNVLIARLRTEP